MLRHRAATAHQSLQEYLRSRLIEEASRPTVDEVLSVPGTAPAGRPPWPKPPQLCGTTVIVVEASVLVTAMADDGPDGDLCRDRLVGQALAAPHLIDLEVGSALRRRVRSGDVPERWARLLDCVLADLQVDAGSGPAVRVDKVAPPLARREPIASRHACRADHSLRRS